MDSRHSVPLDLLRWREGLTAICDALTARIASVPLDLLRWRKGLTTNGFPAYRWTYCAGAKA
ncbi:MAG: hypothetical protein IPG71_02525 [bacterium]|nr:hypothetical protein [bacterium]